MSKRRRGFQQRDPSQTRASRCPRRQGVGWEARTQWPMPVRVR